MLTSLDCIHQLTKLVRGDRFGSCKKATASAYSLEDVVRALLMKSGMCTIHLGFQGGRMDPALQYYKLLEREKTVNLWRRDRCDA